MVRYLADRTFQLREELREAVQRPQRLRLRVVVPGVEEPGLAPRVREGLGAPLPLRGVEEDLRQRESLQS